MVLNFQSSRFKVLTMTQREKSFQPAVNLTGTLQSHLTIIDLLTDRLTLPAVVVQFVSAHTAAAPRQAVLALRTVVVAAAVILGAVSGCLNWTTHDTDDYFTCEQSHIKDWMAKIESAHSLFRGKCVLAL